MATLRKGSKVYIDCSAGLIAGVVVEMVSQHSSEYTGIQYPTSASVRVTSPSRRGYVRGEIVTRPVSRVVPRECIRRRKYSTRIMRYDVLV